MNRCHGGKWTITDCDVEKILTLLKTFKRNDLAISNSNRKETFSKLLFSQPVHQCVMRILVSCMQFAQHSAVKWCLTGSDKYFQWQHCRRVAALVNDLDADKSGRWKVWGAIVRNLSQHKRIGLVLLFFVKYIFSLQFFSFKFFYIKSLVISYWHYHQTTINLDWGTRKVCLFI